MALFLRLNTAEDLKFHYKFSEKAQPLYVKVALSVVDPEGAEKNLEAELPGWDFDKTREEMCIRDSPYTHRTVTRWLSLRTAPPYV